MAINRSGWVYRFVGLTAALNLAWEILQLPLFTIWVEGSTRDITFAVLHCTVGDVLIASLSLLAAVALVQARDWPQRHSVGVWLLTVVFGWVYTGYSEWYNTTVTHAWTYSSLMPQFAGIGLSPLAQWLLVPSTVFWWAFNRSGEIRANS